MDRRHQLRPPIGDFAIGCARPNRFSRPPPPPPPLPPPYGHQNQNHFQQPPYHHRARYPFLQPQHQQFVYRNNGGPPRPIGQWAAPPPPPPPPPPSEPPPAAEHHRQLDDSVFSADNEASFYADAQHWPGPTPAAADEDPAVTVPPMKLARLTDEASPKSMLPESWKPDSEVEPERDADDFEGEGEAVECPDDNHPDGGRLPVAMATPLSRRSYRRLLAREAVQPGADIAAEFDGQLLSELAGIKSTQEPPFVYFYACDYCSFCTEYEGQAAANLAKEHLSAAGHGTASRYARTEDGSVCLANAAQLLAPRCSKRAAESGRLAFVCPTCLLLFDSKFTCGLHHLLHHPGRAELYSVLPVLASRSVGFTPAHLCKPCGRQFHLADELHRHWAAGGSCCPFPGMPTVELRQQQDLLVNATCPYCRRQFASVLPATGASGGGSVSPTAAAMLSARSHIVTAHPDRSSGSHSALLSMRVAFLGLGQNRTRVLAVPPLTRRSACDTLLHCIKLAKEAKAQLDKDCSAELPLCERLKAEIVELQRVMLAATK